MLTLVELWQDVFLFPCLLNDNYEKSLVERFDQVMMEGAYGYTDGAFDVRVKANDVVIDAGAWIGDYSAYAASKGATVYAFEPTTSIYSVLEQTAKLNEPQVIIPIKKGLGESEAKVAICINEKYNTGGNSTVIINSAKSEMITITTLDRFVAKNNITRIDFIKADIEGAERDMLRGAVNVLKTHAPKLAICTYHFPEDPKLLESIILEANPNYTVIHTRQKLFAMVLES
ncbi:hypothetical protein AGMMS49521_1130 [Campylobacterota bacterium]|nr:hypothetical protein AGMMS49521_1130 [Campylobacterota bacterium]